MAIDRLHLLGGLLAGLLASAGCEAPARPSTATTTFALGTFTELTSFGANPGALRGFVYEPQGIGANAPLVVALHACGMTASDYQRAGWNAVADRLGFYVLYPQQETGNNALRCFNWAGEFGDRANLARGQGENASIMNMVSHLQSTRSIDAARVFVAGQSGGASQAILMLATWPDRFAAGASIAGVPYDCTATFSQVSRCLSPGIDRTPLEWGDRVRAVQPSYAGPWPRVAIWHGAVDTTVAPANQIELLEQWTQVHGIDAIADAVDTVDGATRRRFVDAQQLVRVETLEIPNFAHGTPIDVTSGCGQAGAGVIDGPLCAAERLADFFGLGGSSSPDAGFVDASVRPDAVTLDATPRDGGPADSGAPSDAGIADRGTMDGGFADVDTVDAGGGGDAVSSDSGDPDAGDSDGGDSDAGDSDATAADDVPTPASDASPNPRGGSPRRPEGCACVTTEPAPPFSGLVLAAAAALAWVGRRRPGSPWAGERSGPRSATRR